MRIKASILTLLLLVSLGVNVYLFNEVEDKDKQVQMARIVIGEVSEGGSKVIKRGEEELDLSIVQGYLNNPELRKESLTEMQEFIDNSGIKDKIKDEVINILED